MYKNNHFIYFVSQVQTHLLKFAHLLIISPQKKKKLLLLPKKGTNLKAAFLTVHTVKASGDPSQAK